MKTTTWLIVAAVIAGVILIWALAGGFSSAVPVEVAEVKKGPIKEFIDERGVTRLPRTYLITMPYNGIIDDITVTEGQAVVHDDEKPVATVVQSDLEHAVAQVQAVVDGLDAAIERNADSKVEDLVKQQADKFVLSMADTVMAAQKQVDAAEKKLEYSETYLGRLNRIKEEETMAVSQDDLDQAKLRYAEDQLEVEQTGLIRSAMVSIAAATGFLPDMVQQYIGRKDLTEAVLLKEKAEAMARLAQAELERARGKIVSPVDGVVLQRFVNNRQFLAAGTRLMEIGRLEDLEIEADVLSLDVVNAQKGDPVEIYGPAVGEEPAHGKVFNIYPAGFTKISSLGVEQQRVKVIIHFDQQDLQRLRNQRHLEVGYRVRVRITTDQKPDATIIPRSALFRGPGGTWQVYALRSGRARIEDVTIGMINDEHAEVTAGLEPGDQVVRAPESNLAGGQRVTVVQEEAEEEKAGEEESGGAKDQVAREE